MKKEKYIELNKTYEEYIQIYHEYYVLNWNQYDISKYHKCSQFKISTALNWVEKNKLKIPAKQLIDGAIDAVKVRLKKNKALYDKEFNRARGINHKLLLELNKELREDEKLLFHLQNILTEKFQLIDTTNAANILKMINEARTSPVEVEDKTILPNG
jgi:hypothetical protein